MEPSTLNPKPLKLNDSRVQTGRNLPRAWRLSEFAYKVRSRSHTNKIYIVTIDPQTATVSCGCEDYQLGHNLCFHCTRVMQSHVRRTLGRRVA